jgi:hypothetical protein
MLPEYLLNHVYSFIDFHSIVKLLSVPSVYRYLLTLATFVKNMGGPVKESILATLEPFYHLNQYHGINIYIIYNFIKGARIYGNNINYGLTRELWIHNYEWHRVYGPAVIYRGMAQPNPYQEGWYRNGAKHRPGNKPSIIIYYDNGSVHLQGFTVNDQPFRRDHGPTTVEFDQSGNVISELWQNTDSTIKMIKYI